MSSNITWTQNSTTGTDQNYTILESNPDKKCKKKLGQILIKIFEYEHAKGEKQHTAQEFEMLFQSIKQIITS